MRMQLNGKNLYDVFHMRVKSFTFQPLHIEGNYMQQEGTIWPIQSTPIVSAKPMVIEADFRTAIDISNFIAEIYHNDHNILDMDDGFLYHCSLEGVDQCVDESWTGWYHVSLDLKVVQTGNLIKASSDSFDVKGNFETECRYEILSTNPLNTFTVDDYTVKGLEANRKFILDGIEKKIYYEDEPYISKFDDTDIVAFPKLNPGIHNIVKSNSSVKITIVYYPTFM